MSAAIENLADLHAQVHQLEGDLLVREHLALLGRRRRAFSRLAAEHRETIGALVLQLEEVVARSAESVDHGLEAHLDLRLAKRGGAFGRGVRRRLRVGPLLFAERDANGRERFLLELVELLVLSVVGAGVRLLLALADHVLRLFRDLVRGGRRRRGRRGGVACALLGGTCLGRHEHGAAGHRGDREKAEQGGDRALHVEGCYVGKAPTFPTSVWAQTM